MLGIIHWEQDERGKPFQDAVRSLLVSLFREDSLPFIGKQLAQDTTAGASGAFDAEQALMLLDAALGGKSRDLPSLYQEWLHGHEDASNTLQILFEQRWNTVEGFATWLEDMSVPIAAKREQLSEAAQEKPQAWLQLLRALPQESRASISLETLMSTQDMLQAVAKVNFHQMAVLSRTIERLQHPVTHLHASLARGSISLDALLRKALLAYLQDPETWERTQSEKDITDLFLRYLRLAADGKEQDDTDNRHWRQLAETITNGNPEADSQLPKDLLETLADSSAPHAVLRQTVCNGESMAGKKEPDTEQPEVPQVSETIVAEPESLSQEAGEPMLPAPDERMLRGINPEYRAWIFIPGTAVNYPVLLPKSNETYLDQTFDGRSNSCGALFFDLRVVPGRDGPGVIHGHNMRSGAMFGGLKSYLSRDYLQEHAEIYLLRDGQWEKYRVLSAGILSEAALLERLESEDKPERLLLCTCYGRSDRLVLDAEEVNTISS